MRLLIGTWLVVYGALETGSYYLIPIGGVLIAWGLRASGDWQFVPRPPPLEPLGGWPDASKVQRICEWASGALIFVAVAQLADTFFNFEYLTQSTELGPYVLGFGVIVGAAGLGLSLFVLAQAETSAHTRLLVLILLLMVAAHSFLLNGLHLLIQLLRAWDSIPGGDSSGLLRSARWLLLRAAFLFHPSDLWLFASVVFVVLTRNSPARLRPQQLLGGRPYPSPSTAWGAVAASTWLCLSAVHGVMSLPMLVLGIIIAIAVLFLSVLRRRSPRRDLLSGLAAVAAIVLVLILAPRDSFSPTQASVVATVSVVAGVAVWRMRSREIAAATPQAVWLFALSLTIESFFFPGAGSGFRALGVPDPAFVLLLIPLLDGLRYLVLQFRRASKPQRVVLAPLFSGFFLAVPAGIVGMGVFYARNATDCGTLLCRLEGHQDALTMLPLPILTVAFAIGVFFSGIAGPTLALRKTAAMGATGLTAIVVFAALQDALSAALPSSTTSGSASLISAGVLAVTISPIQKRCEHLARLVLHRALGEESGEVGREASPRDA